ncbi:pentapeptide repeat-containing protein [Pseudonocardia sp.]|uniref:pentapeptide repeat-containing protein n=1 Tax=Pseudonocardia sp. TaxID=60912 RepID=UPI0026304469|nr:pentapeptide repeat-containing protein [Pseudonocardia sp.]
MARPKKVRPDPPDLPAGWDPAPPALESGAQWDGVQAGAECHVPQELSGVELRECRWVRADLAGRRITGLRCRDVTFEHCDLSGAVLDGAVLTRVRFTACRLTGLQLGGAELADVRISDCRADLVNLRMARARHLLVENTPSPALDLYSFTGTDCSLLGCDLTGVNLTEARFTNLQLHGSVVEDVTGAAALRGARISPDQIVPIGAALLAALDIRATDPPA